MSEAVRDFYESIARNRDVASSVRALSGLRPGVLDAASFRILEVDRIFDAINGCHTRAGQATLYHSLAYPSVSTEAIRSKQEALRELESNAALRERLQQFIRAAAVREQPFYELLFGSFMGFLGATPNKMEYEGYGYAAYKHGTRFMIELAADARHLPTPESPYLAARVEAIRGYEATAAHALMRGPVYLTERGLKLGREKRRYSPAIRFRPSLFKPLLLGAAALGYFILTSPWLAAYIATPANPVLMVSLLPLLVLYVPAVGSFDRDSFIYPLRDSFREAEETQNTLGALGAIDELLAFHQYASGFGSAMVLPRILDAGRHTLALEQVRNPVLAKGNPAYVANDIDLGAARLGFVTGPNSGGKTAFCKTLAQVQLLAQIGCYVPAVDAEMAVADRINYQAPETGSLADLEGRFGTELQRTKEIFLATTPRSLVILDEMAEGTTFEEKLTISHAILNGFRRIGNTTILITHNHELVERFRKDRIGLYRQVDFSHEAPTYRLIDGISKVSHAERVARKLGFAREDIEQYLTARGY
ncbi:MAG: DNA mismatch repair protein MutS [Gammaproteobacteria bacterium]|nr:DNA mismatch repair protein MutS [Gammaproteobacteria bacterium]